MQNTKKILAKSTLPVFLLLGFSGVIFAQVADQPPQVNAVFVCKTETDPMARLACYENAANQLETAIATGEIVAVSKTQVENVERDAFGFNIPSLPNLGKLFGGGSSSKKPAKSAILTPDGPRTTPSTTTPDTTPAPPREPINSIDLEIAKIATFGYKKHRFFLKNGQVWEQKDSGKVRVPKIRDGVPNRVEISKAALGSYMLRINGKGRAIRVGRVR